MNYVDDQYLTIMKDILENGVHRGDRTGTGTYSIFGPQMTFNLADGFPLLTTKKLHLKSIIHELLWFIRGDTNIKYLNDNDVHIWDKWANEKGELGPVYGRQWRAWKGYPEFGPYDDPSVDNVYIDQIKNVIDLIKNDPNGRRHIVTAWNPDEIDEQALPPCHCLFQFYVGNGKLSCKLYQRSADWFLGVPFNIASYALLTHLVARECGLQVGKFIHTFGDAHLYANHQDQAIEQIARLPYNRLPLLAINAEPEVDIFNIKYEDIEIIGYEAWPNIKAEISV